MNAAPAVNFTELLFASLLLLANAGLSLALGLGLARPLLIAGVRVVAQLLLVGLVLKMVFTSQSPWLVGAVLVFMLVAAAREIHARQERRLLGWWGWGVGATMSTLATVVVAGLGLALLAHRPWWTPQAAIPMVGIVLGSAIVVGTLLGAMLAALATRSARWEGFDSPRRLAASFVGGLLMGFGGVVAVGCTIGQGLSGLSALALASVPAIGGIVVGALVWLRLRPGSAGTA